MDALAGYGSSDSSGSSNQEVGNSGTKTGISGLIGHYSDDSDVDEQNKVTTHTVHHAPQPGVSGGPISEVVKKGVQNEDAQEVNDGGEEKQQVDGQPKKRQRRWDVDMTANNTINIDSLLPAPTLLSSSTDPFQSMTLFDKDHTTELRKKLAEQLQTQTQAQEGKLGSTEKQQQLTKKLEQLYDKFQQNHQPDGSSFAAHLKSSHEFGNPNLIKTVIDHFEIKPLESHVGNSFKGFETVDRLMAAEERARIVAANYDAGSGSTNMAPTPQSGS